MKKVKLIDLSTVISPGMPKPKSAPPVLLRYILEPSEEQEKAQGFTNKMEEYTITTHVATHIDAPAHFSAHGKNIDEYDVSEFFLVPTQMLNIRRGKFEAITADDLRAAEERDGAIQDGDLVLINTGCHQYYYDEVYNCAPYLTKEAAEYLAEKQIKMVGTDSFTVDDPREKDKPAHVVLLNQHGILIIECVMNLDAIPCTRFQTVCLPLKIRQGSGAFTRMIAVCE